MMCFHLLSEHPGQEGRAASASAMKCGKPAVGICSLAQDATIPLGQIRRVPGRCSPPSHASSEHPSGQGTRRQCRCCHRWPRGTPPRPLASCLRLPPALHGSAVPLHHSLCQESPRPQHQPQQLWLPLPELAAMGKGAPKPGSHRGWDDPGAQRWQGTSCPASQATGNRTHSHKGLGERPPPNKSPAAQDRT